MAKIMLLLFIQCTVSIVHGKCKYFWCERCNLLCSHSNGDIITREDNMLFSHVKISSFRAKAHLVFHWCLNNKNKISTQGFLQLRGLLQQYDTEQDVTALW